MLPELVREADSEWLAGPLAEHLEQTRQHAARVEEVLVAVSGETSSALSPPLEGLRRQHDELAGTLVEPRLKDVFLAGAAARSEHLELAVYDSLLLLGAHLGVDTKPLEQNRAEDARALKQLERAAEKLCEKLP